MFMASNRKIWKTRKVAHSLLFGIIILVLLLVIYDKRKSRTSSTIYILNDGGADTFEYHRQTANPNPPEYVKILLPQESKTKVEFKGSWTERAEEGGVSISTFPGKRMVHLDLKGAPPRVSYLAELFPLLRRFGATGLLLEWEDMFPYVAADVSAGNAYSRDDIARILSLAAQNSLEVVPLIQTFGHLEFLLKLQPFYHLRENNKYPQAICPTKNESLSVLFSMIDEILETHKGIKFFHIGCDEVFQLAQCKDCREALHKRRWNSKDLFLNHVTTLARYIQKKSKGGVKALIWDDLLRSVPLASLKEWRLGELVEPVVWKYTADVESHLTHDLWSKYAEVFNAVWFASAFKGARYPNAFTTYINYYFENHKSWMGILYKYSDKLLFRGGFLTGWQRYDHFAVLCELLPVSIPSLALNLIYLSTDVKSLVELSVKTQRVCGCDANPVMATSPRGTCTFPGACLYTAVSRLPSLIFAFQREKDLPPYKGWLTPYNIHHSFSNPAHVEEATNNLVNIFAEVSDLEREVKDCMDKIYDNSTTTEWLDTYLRPLKDELSSVLIARDKILSRKVWPKRPLV